MRQSVIDKCPAPTGVARHRQQPEGSSAARAADADYVDEQFGALDPHAAQSRGPFIGADGVDVPSESREAEHAAHEQQEYQHAQPEVVLFQRPFRFDQPLVMQFGRRELRV